MDKGNQPSSLGQDIQVTSVDKVNLQAKESTCLNEIQISPNKKRESHQTESFKNSNTSKNSKSNTGQALATIQGETKKSKNEQEDLSQKKSFNPSKQNMSDQSLKSTNLNANDVKSDRRPKIDTSNPIKSRINNDFESVSLKNLDQSFEKMPELTYQNYQNDSDEYTKKRKIRSVDRFDQANQFQFSQLSIQKFHKQNQRKIAQHNLPDFELSYTFYGRQRQYLPPEKKVIDKMLKRIQYNIKKGAYEADYSTKKETNKNRNQKDKKIGKGKTRTKGRIDKKEKKEKKEKKGAKEKKGEQQNQSSSLVIIEDSDEVSGRIIGSQANLPNNNSNAKGDFESQRMNIQQNARAKLQNERMKLNQNLIKQNSQYQQVVIGGNYRSSTNEGSRSVNTFGPLNKVNMINSGSSANSPKSYQSMKGSFDGVGESHEGRSFGFRFRNGDDSSGNQPIRRNSIRRDSQDILQNFSQIKEDESSSNSQFANSVSHSFGSSFYEFKSQQPTQNYQVGKQEKLEKSELFSKLSNDRRSLLSTPLVEFDSLNQVARQEQNRSDRLGFQIRRYDPFHSAENSMKIISQERKPSLPIKKITTTNLSGSDGAQIHFHNRLEFLTSASQRPSLGNSGSMTPVTPKRNVNYQKNNLVDGFPEVEIVQEEILEDDEHNILNSRGRQGRFKLIKDKNEFNKTVKRNRSTDFIIENDVDYKTNNISCHHFGDVSEDDEEQISDSSVEKHQTDINKQQQQKKNKTYSIGYLTKKIWKKKIYSDDFDVDEEVLLKNNKMKFQLGSVVNSAIQEDAEISEIENPYFSDNSNSSHLTQKLRKFSLELQKYLDRSDAESSGVISGISMGAQGNKQSKLSHYHSNINEPIQEVEDEKEEIADQKRQPILESIQKRRNNSKHIERNMAKYFPQRRQSKQIIFESDPIHEEIEIEDDELMSENNFQQRWNHHKRFLLTQDEQMKLMNDDARSSNGNPIDKKLYFPGIHRRSSLSGKIHSRRPKKKNKQNSEQQLAPIEEKNEEIKKEDNDGVEADELELPLANHPTRRMKTEDFSNDQA